MHINQASMPPALVNLWLGTLPNVVKAGSGRTRWYIRLLQHGSATVELLQNAGLADTLLEIEGNVDGVIVGAVSLQLHSV